MIQETDPMKRLKNLGRGGGVFLFFLGTAGSLLWEAVLQKNPALENKKTRIPKKNGGWKIEAKIRVAPISAMKAGNCISPEDYY